MDTITIQYLLNSLEAFKRDPNSEVWNDEDRRYIYRQLYNLSPAFSEYLDEQGKLIGGSEKYLIQQGLTILNSQLNNPQQTNTPSVPINLDELVQYFKAKEIEQQEALARKLSSTTNTLLDRSKVQNTRYREAVNNAIQETAERTAMNVKAETVNQIFEETLQSNIDRDAQLRADLVQDRQLQQMTAALPYAAASVATSQRTAEESRQRFELKNEITEEATDTVNELFSYTKRDENANNAPTTDTPISWGLRRAANKLFGKSDEDYLYQTGVITLADYEKDALTEVAEKVAERTSTIPLREKTTSVLQQAATAIEDDIRQIENPRARTNLVQEDGTLTEKGKLVAAELTSATVQAFETQKDREVKRNLADRIADQVTTDLNNAINYSAVESRNEERLRGYDNVPATPDSPQQNLEKSMELQVRVAKASAEAAQKVIEVLPATATAQEFEDRFKEELVTRLPQEAKNKIEDGFRDRQETQAAQSLYEITDRGAAAPTANTISGILLKELVKNAEKFDAPISKEQLTELNSTIQSSVQSSLERSRTQNSSSEQVLRDVSSDLRERLNQVTLDKDIIVNVEDVVAAAQTPMSDQVRTYQNQITYVQPATVQVQQSSSQGATLAASSTIADIITQEASNQMLPQGKQFTSEQAAAVQAAVTDGATKALSNARLNVAAPHEEVSQNVATAVRESLQSLQDQGIQLNPEVITSAVQQRVENVVATHQQQVAQTRENVASGTGASSVAPTNTTTSYVIQTIVGAATSAYNNSQCEYQITPSLPSHVAAESLSAPIVNELVQQYRAYGNDVSLEQQAVINKSLGKAVQETLEYTRLQQGMSPSEITKEVTQSIRQELQKIKQQQGINIDVDQVIRQTDNKIFDNIQTYSSQVSQYETSNNATQQAMAAFPGQSVTSRPSAINPSRILERSEDTQAIGPLPSTPNRSIIEEISGTNVTQASIRDRKATISTIVDQESIPTPQQPRVGTGKQVEQLVEAITLNSDLIGSLRTDQVEKINELKRFQQDKTAELASLKADQVEKIKAAKKSGDEVRATQLQQALDQSEQQTRYAITDKNKEFLLRNADLVSQHRLIIHNNTFNDMARQANDSWTNATDTRSVNEYAQERTGLLQKQEQYKDAITTQTTFVKNQTTKAIEELAQNNPLGPKTQKAFESELHGLIENYTQELAANGNNAALLQKKITTKIQEFTTQQQIDLPSQSKLLAQVNKVIDNASESIIINRDLATKTQTVLFDNDKHFFEKNPTAVQQYYQPNFITQGEQAALRLPVQAPEQWHQVLKEIYKTDSNNASATLHIQEIEDIKVLQKSPYALEAILNDVKEGRLTTEQARVQLKTAAEETRSSFQTMIRQAQEVNYSTNTYYDQAEKNQRAIDSGTKVLSEQFGTMILQGIGQEKFKELKLKKTEDIELALVNKLSRKEFEKRKYEQLPDGRMVERKDYNPEQLLVKVLGERALRSDGNLQLQYQVFMKDFTQSVLSTQHSTDPSDLPGNVRGIFQAKFNEYFPSRTSALDETTRKALLNSIDQHIDSITARLGRNSELNKSFTAAKNASLIVANIDLGVEDEYKNIIDKNAIFHIPSENPSAYKLSAKQLIEESIREEYKSGLTQVLVGLNIKDNRARDLASAAIYNALGGLTPEIDKDGNDTIGERKVATGTIKKWNKIQQIQFERMSDKDKEAFLKRLPEEEQQRINIIIIAALNTLKTQDLSPTQLAEVEKHLRERLQTEGLHKKQILEMAIEAEKDPYSNFKLATQSALPSLPSNRALEHFIANIPFSVVNNIGHHLPFTLPAHDGFVMESMINSRGATKQYDTKYKIYLTQFRLWGREEDIKKAIESGSIPGELKDLKGLSERGLRDLIKRRQWLGKVATFRAQHPELANLADRRAAFFEKDSVAIMNQLLRSQDPLNTGISMGANWLVNNAKLKYFGKYYSRNPITKRVQFDPLYKAKEAALDKMRFHREQLVFRLKNTRLVHWVRRKMIDPAKKLVQAGIKWILSKISERVKSFVINAIAFAAGPIGWLVKGLLWISNLPGFKQIKQAIQLILASIVGTIFRILVSFLGPIIGFLLNPIGSLGSFLGISGSASVATTAIQGGALSSIGLTGFGSSSLAVTLNNFIGFASNAAFGTLSTTLNIAKAMINPSLIPSLFAKFTGWASAQPLTLAALTTTGLVSVFGSTYMITLLAAIKDGPDTITLAGDSTPYSNPLQVSKSATPNKLSGDPNSPDRQTEFLITLKSPPCSSLITIRDTVPENMEYVDPSIFSRPNQSDINSTPNSTIKTISSTVTGRELRWDITLDETKVSTSGCAGINGEEDLRNWQILGDEATSVEKINAMLQDHRMKGLGQEFYNAAKTYEINPLLVIGIYHFESELGDTGIGKPPTDTDGDGVRDSGCYNPGGTRGGNQGCPSADKNGDGEPDAGYFRMFSSYPEAIQDTFRLLREIYFDQGLVTVDQIINKYTPLSDNNAQNNPNSKRVVRCTLFYQTPCRSDVGGVAYQGDTVSIEVGFRANVISSYTTGCITNTAIISHGDLSNSATTNVTVGDGKCNDSGEFCNAPPADTGTLKAKLNAALIYPTNSTTYAPSNGGWTRNQYELLWKLACRITQSPTFMASAAGSEGFEIQRISCLPTAPLDETGRPIWPICPSYPRHRAYFKGSNISYSMQPGTRLLLITDKIIGQTDALFIHLVAHEMGHSAAAAGGQLGSNPIYQSFPGPSTGCTNYISGYVHDYAIAGAGCSTIKGESFAEAIGFYLTGGENASRYYGYDQPPKPPNGGDFRQEATTPGWLQDYYIHLKTRLFDNVEFDNNLP